MNSRRLKARFFLLSPLLLILFAVPLLSAAAPESAGQSPAPSRLEQQVREWMNALSVQKPFAEWKRAEPDIQPLGPGTHGWLAVLTADGRPVGYLVVYASGDGGFRLGEYGVGPNVLFSPSALKTTLLENGLIESDQAPYTAERRYFHPFAAAWEVGVGTETYWIDAKTNEVLPLDRDIWTRLLPSLQSAANGEEPEEYEEAKASDASYVGETFNAYDRLPWLDGEKPYVVGNGKKVQNRIRSGLHLRYVTEPYGDAALYALAVIGYHRWTDGRLDLVLDMEGDRYIPLRQLERHGRFYE